LRIYVDGMFYRLSGIGRCYENVLSALLAAADVSKVFTVVPGIRGEEFGRQFRSDKLEARFVDFAHLSPGDFFRKAQVIRAFSPDPDILFFPNFNVPFFLRGKIVSTVHDLTPLSRYSGSSRVQQAGFRFLVRRALHISERTVCVSEFGRRQVMDVFGMPCARLQVIHNWVSDGFLSGEETAGERASLVEGEYLLFVGNRYAYKNLGGLLAAFRLLLPEFPGLKAAVVGVQKGTRGDAERLMADPSLKGRVVEFPRASDDELKALYARAKVFVFPSFMEGFGLPPLEALAFGVPVVCSDIPVIREVCGDAVRYADPFDPASIAGQIRCALIETERNEVYREKGIERVHRYSREESIRRYLELFRACMEAAGEGPRRGDGG
jgi:glycosyltransferase involved in cell wall biosynthesis